MGKSKGKKYGNRSLPKASDELVSKLHAGFGKHAVKGTEDVRWKGHEIHVLDIAWECFAEFMTRVHGPEIVKAVYDLRQGKSVTFKPRKG